MWRCLNDIFNYCSGEPEASKEGENIKSGTIETTIHTCNLNPKTCGKLQTLLEQIDPDKLDQLTGDSYQRVVAKAVEVEKANKKKPSPEAAQGGRLF